MQPRSSAEPFQPPAAANFVVDGKGAPVVLIHGLAASLHDWDYLIPELVRAGYAAYALDLLGHGDSPKPRRRDYSIDWLFDHLDRWIESLALSEPVVLTGHSLGGYLALEYARRRPAETRALILVNPVYSRNQLTGMPRLAHRLPVISEWLILHTPEWLLRALIDVSSIWAGHGHGGLHALPREVRAQTALDYSRTFPGAYRVLGESLDLTPFLSSIQMPVLVLWGEGDQTLATASFPKLVEALPNAHGRSIHAGHVPHQSRAEWFNSVVLEFLGSLPEPRSGQNDSRTPILKGR